MITVLGGGGTTLYQSSREVAVLRVFAPSRAFALSHPPMHHPTLQRDIEEIASIVVDASLHVHRELGPGLLESVYEVVLAKVLEDRGLLVERQKVVPVYFEDVRISDGFRLDLLVNDKLIIELKSVEIFHPVHAKQLLTYLRLMKLPLGLLINFGAALLKEGLQRVVNGHSDTRSSRLRLHRSAGGLSSRLER